MHSFFLDKSMEYGLGEQARLSDETEQCFFPLVLLPFKS